MKKLIAAAICIILLVTLYLIDFGISRKYEYELINTTSETFVADGLSTVRITVKLSKDEKPVEGHTIYIFASNGTLPSSRCVTDADGEFMFRYYPYLYLNDKLTPLEDVTITLRDESNSFFFMVCATEEYTFKVEKPEAESVWDDWENIGS